MPAVVFMHLFLLLRDAPVHSDLPDRHTVVIYFSTVQPMGIPFDEVVINRRFDA